MLKLAYNVGLSIFSLQELLMKKSNDTFAKTSTTIFSGGEFSGVDADWFIFKSSAIIENVLRLSEN